MWSSGHDTNDDGESILLLQPVITSRSKSKQSTNYPSTSKIGGVPNYHENDTLLTSIINNGGTSSSINPKCTRCENQMYLLLQMHTPMDDYDRTLYVFGCNNAACYSQIEKKDQQGSDACISRFHPCIGNDGIGGPLRCLRSQKRWSTSTSNSSKPVSKTSESTKQQPSLAVNDWGVDDGSDDWGDDDDDDDWGGGNNDSNNPEISMNEIETMLTKCEMQSTSKATEQQKQKATTAMAHSSTKDSNNIKNKSEVGPALPSFEQYDLEMLNEPHSGNANDSDEEDEGGCSNVDSSKVDQMLSRYLDMEEDEEILSVLKGGGKHSVSGSQSDGKGGSRGGGERYERLPPEERAFLQFSQRLKRSPGQVARYAYGGLPLWSIPLPLTNSDTGNHQRKSNHKQKSKQKPQKVYSPLPNVPRCTCGAARVFEFTLLPSILHVLNVDSYATKEEKKNGDDDMMDLISEGGMNWGSIAVYSCSESCEQSREEFIIMQESVCDAPLEKTKPAANGNSDEEMDDN